MADDRRQIAEEMAEALHQALCSSCYPAARTGFLFASADAHKAADALLPLIDRVKAEAAADALEQAGDVLDEVTGSVPWEASWLRDRARDYRTTHTATDAQEASTNGR